MMTPEITHGFGVVLGVVLILLSSVAPETYISRIPGTKNARPGRLRSALYFSAGCFFLLVEAAYFWFDVDVFNPSTYR
jgi:hypothetical protein